jgi:hypothetical protein
LTKKKNIEEIKARYIQNKYCTVAEIEKLINETTYDPKREKGWRVGVKGNFWYIQTIV